MGQLLNDFLSLQAQTSDHPMGIEVDRAEGVFLYDTNGKRFYDMTSGLAVANLGHRHPQIIEAIQLQLDKHLHVMPYGEYAQKPQVDLAMQLQGSLPEKLNTPYFVNSGTEANEAALKLAKRATQRTELVSFKGSYHGNTHGSMSVSWSEKKKSAFRPLLPDVKFLEFNDPSQLDWITERTAGVIIEPIQGDAGVRVPSDSFMKDLRNRCDEVGALLIMDEIQTGMGRTGELFAHRLFDVVPDILTLGKALGGGMPIGAFCASKELMKLWTSAPALGHITTFGGHPISCAAAARSIELTNNELLLQTVSDKELVIRSIMHSENIAEIRGTGLMMAIELADEQAVQRVVNECKERGVLIFWFLSCENSFRLTPPLNITDQELMDACTIINEVISEVGG